MLIVLLIALQLIIFGGLIFIMKRTLTSNITSATNHLELLNQDYTKKEEDLSRRIEEVKNKSEQMLNSSREEAEKMKTQIITAAEAEKDRIMKTTRAQSEEMIKQADRSRQSLISEMEARISIEAINKACGLIQVVLPEDVKRAAHIQLVDDLAKHGFSDLERLRIPEGVDQINITSALPLTEEQRKAFTRRLKEIMKKDIKLKEEVDLKLVAGLIISIGSLVLDGSMRNKIREQAEKEKA